MLAITNLFIETVFDLPVFTFDGLEYATNLQALNAPKVDGAISLNPFWHLPHLQELSLPQSEFSDVTPLLLLTNLKYIDLSETTVTNLQALAAHPTLISLGFADNGVTNAEIFSAFSQLVGLSLIGNPIRDVAPLGWMTNLIDLSLEGTPLTNPSALTNNPHFKGLLLRQCGLTNISFLGALTNLETLVVRENNIQDCTPLASLTKLTILDAAQNLLTNLGPMLNCPITYLDVTRNFLWNTNFGFNPPTVSVIQAVQSRGGTAFYSAQAMWGTIRVSITREASGARIHWHREPANLPFRLQYLTDDEEIWHNWIIDDFSSESAPILVHPDVQIKKYRAILGSN